MQDEEILATEFSKDIEHKSFPKSYRSEVQASYSSFLFLQEFTSFFGLNIPTTFYYCNNIGVVTKLQNNNNIFNKQKENDILPLMLQVLPKTTTVEHVRAHQDEKY